MGTNGLIRWFKAHQRGNLGLIVKGQSLFCPFYQLMQIEAYRHLLVFYRSQIFQLFLCQNPTLNQRLPVRPTEHDMGNPFQCMDVSKAACPLLNVRFQGHSAVFWPRASRVSF